MATDGPDPIPCDDEIYKNGIPICMITEVSSNRLENFIVLIREFTNQRVDWHFSGGRAIVKVIGDSESVKLAIASKHKELKKLCLETSSINEGWDPLYWL